MMDDSAFIFWKLAERDETRTSAIQPVSS